MECNKEEAFRAKDIAEKKLESKDFSGARKFAVKAQQLHPEIENVSRMICVCDVHCSAEKKVHGNEMDWYGILQIEQTADDNAIKKQYRRFALLLHPDKNKFAGAEAAFKLVGEAQRVLLDKEKRQFHDIRRRTSYKPVIPHQQSGRNVSVVKQSRAPNNFPNNPNPHVRAYPPSQEHKQQAQAGGTNGGTFWTQCPYCSIRYQYYKEIKGRTILCSSCRRTFFAYDIHDPGSGAAPPVFPQHNASASTVESQVKNPKPSPFTETQASQKAEVKPPMARQSQKHSSKVDKGEETSKTRKANGQRRKKHVDSSESLESDSIVDSEEPETAGSMGGLQFDSEGDCRARRSNRNKRHVSYKERVSDDEGTSSKRSKVNTSSSPVLEKKTDSSEVFGKNSNKGDCNIADESETVAGSSQMSDDDHEFDSSPESSPVPSFHEYPDPEFSDFDKMREEHCFKVGQIWAAYDTAGAMPRFYAKIKKIFSSGFKLTITWLEADPDDEAGRGWAALELPYACGKFKLGHSERTEDRLMFSHMVSGWNSIGKNTFTIYPRIGETWALFKNWNVKWSLMPENDSDRKFEYEFVEIVSHFNEINGIQVTPLGKLKGFASLFYRKNSDVHRIPVAEILRFSHMVPSYRMTGNERKDVPKGSFELDPASIATDIDEIDPPLSDRTSSNIFQEFAGESRAGVSESTSVGNGNGGQVERRKNPNGDVAGGAFADTEFFNFDAIRPVDKFQENQIWALYGDVDGLPKYYGVVNKIECHPAFKLQIAWLEACFLPPSVLPWKDRKMPISCGVFKYRMAKAQIYKDTTAFSHEIHVEMTSKKNVYAIYPRKGEVWALYKSWRTDMMAHCLLSCDYDTVEVLSESDSTYRVSTLERIDGYNSVFKHRSGDRDCIRDIPRAELLRFSHQIPCFRLTNEKGGSLNGFLKLDPAAFPTGSMYKSK